VLENLKIAFPNKPEKELKSIRRKFYRHFVDIFMEVIKSFTISKKALDKHYTYTNLELLDELYKDGKSIVLVGSHYANWEWIIGLSGHIKYKGYAAFTRVSNKYFNAKVLKSREKFGAKFIKTSSIIAQMDRNQKENIQSLYGLLSDQSPQLKKTHYWSEVFGIKIPVHTGAEMLAKKYDMNVVYIHTKKVKRGYYETTFELITDDVKQYSDYNLSDVFLRKTEQQILQKPEHYFWTHNRFKHKDKYEEYLNLRKNKSLN
jgi:KDO2-lipid IV(A) lauroyltransferase